MSVSFYGEKADGTPVLLDIEHAAYFNMSSANARAFLLFLGLDPGDEPMGEITMPVARRAILRARASFERRVGGFTRQHSDTKRPGQVRVVVRGIDARYFATRLHDLEKFLNVVSEMGATSIRWGP